jgi:hypothetical protein
VLFGRTVLEVEQGNTAFGGNGAKANYVAVNGHIDVGPALISEALSRLPTKHHRFAMVRGPRQNRAFDE